MTGPSAKLSSASVTQTLAGLNDLDPTIWCPVEFVYAGKKSYFRPTPEQWDWHDRIDGKPAARFSLKRCDKRSLEHYWKLLDAHNRTPLEAFRLREHALMGDITHSGGATEEYYLRLIYRMLVDQNVPPFGRLPPPPKFPVPPLPSKRTNMPADQTRAPEGLVAYQARISAAPMRPEKKGRGRPSKAHEKAEIVAAVDSLQRQFPHSVAEAARRLRKRFGISPQRIRAIYSEWNRQKYRSKMASNTAWESSIDPSPRLNEPYEQYSADILSSDLASLAQGTLIHNRLLSDETEFVRAVQASKARAPRSD